MTLPFDAHTREVFYAGGEYVTSANGQQSLRGQIYVEHLTPALAGKAIRKYPIVFIPGGGRTGDFLTTPDGRPGWSSLFLSRGYEVYIIDQAFRGRSPWHPDAGDYLAFSAELAEKIWTCPAAAETPLWPKASLHTQWPGPGTHGDAVFDAMFASMSPSLQDHRLQEGATTKACLALLDRIARPVILIGHSLGTTVGWLVADARPALTKAIVAVEPAGPPFVGMGAAGPRAASTQYGLTHSPLTYEPPVNDPKRELVMATRKAAVEGCCDTVLQANDPPPRRLVNLMNIPMVIITGEASKHALYDWGTVEFLKQAGVARAEHILLKERGIHGNGHMLLVEKNSDEIAELMLDWTEKL